MYVCVCRGVTDQAIRREVAEGVRTVRELNTRLGLGSQCGKCGRCARHVLKQALTDDAGPSMGAIAAA